MRASQPWPFRSVLLLSLLVGGWAASPSPASAQYFGRNKVQYETFDFRVLKTPHFDVYYYPEEEVAARDAARMAERWYARLSTVLDYQFEQRQPLVLYGSHPAFQQTTTLGGQVGEGTGGVTEAYKQRVIMPLTGSYQETDHVLGHELVHAFQYDISGLGRAGGGLEAAARRFNVPLWFVEGMAEYLSVGPVDAHTAMWLRDAALTGDLPSVEQLSTDPRIFPYRYGHALWAYIGGRWGDAVIGQILKLVGEGVPYEEAFQRLLNVELDEIGEDWQASIRRAYLPLLAERPEAREIARPLITNEKRGGRLNLGPALSPDGRFVAYLSNVDFGDVEVFLANAETGRTIRKLVKGTAFDPHFQSLRYINSAGTFSPDGRRFAFSALRGGRDVLVILDTRNGDIEREIRIPAVSEITSPSWSPDGATIVFAGVEGGVSDLYEYNLRTEQTRRLTDDRFANLHPDISPDGRTVAYVTDQGAGTDLGALRYGGYRIALLDLATGQSRIVPQTDGGTVAPATPPNFEASSINPMWTRDGNGLYFVSNRTGIPNIYRLELASGQLFQLTKLFGGVSGITDISPTMAVARNADRVLFTAYEENGYNIYALSTPQELAGTPVTAPAVAVADSTARARTVRDSTTVFPAVLPPAPRPAGEPFNRVANLIRNPELGLPAPSVAAAWETVPYGPALSLDYLGQPQVGYSTGGVLGQGGLSGGINGIFSDILGYNTVYGTVLAQGQFDEVGFSAAYLNRKYRWNYGAQAQRVPYISIRQAAQFDPETGILRNQLQRYRTFNWSLLGLAQYPFSPSQRLEFSGGLRRVVQDVQADETVGPAIVQGGRIVRFQPVERQRITLDELSNTYNLAEASAALVYDNSLFGYTSPFAGQRYRFELSPTFGTLQFVQALADYRRYQWVRPFTLAVQGIHFGRYGQDSENVFFPLFLGQPSLVRGYSGAFSQCRNNPVNCEPEVIEALFGSRVAVAKAEVRFPLVRALVLGIGLGFPPIEGFGFFDAGIAWNQSTTPTFARGIPLDVNDRGLLTSAGVGARINLFGFAIAEINYVNAFERAEGWHWQFALQPGF